MRKEGESIKNIDTVIVEIAERVMKEALELNLLFVAVYRKSIEDQGVLKKTE